MFFLLHAAVLMDSVATALSKESASGHSGGDTLLPPESL